MTRFVGGKIFLVNLNYTLTSSNPKALTGSREEGIIEVKNITEGVIEAKMRVPFAQPLLHSAW